VLALLTVSSSFSDPLLPESVTFSSALVASLFPPCGCPFLFCATPSSSFLYSCFLTPLSLLPSLDSDLFDPAFLPVIVAEPRRRLFFRPQPGLRPLCHPFSLGPLDLSTTPLFPPAQPPSPLCPSVTGAAFRMPGTLPPRLRP
jgi:hypothetical protein